MKTLTVGGLTRQTLPNKCLCGSSPVVENNYVCVYGATTGVFKYWCPNCTEKTLPFLRQWDDCGALHEWNFIAPLDNYVKRTLKYNEFGVCVDKPHKVFHWKHNRDHIELNVYFDNGLYYFDYSFSFGDGGQFSPLSLRDEGFSTIALLTDNARHTLLSYDVAPKNIHELFYSPKESVQLEMF